MGNWKDDKKGGPDLEPGSYAARIYSVVEIGTHDNPFSDKKRSQVVVTWELPTEKRDDGRPTAQSRFYTLSMFKLANLRKDIETLLGKMTDEEADAGFDPTKLLGQPCFIVLAKNKNDKTTVNGMSALPKGMEVEEQHNDSIYYDIQKHDTEVFDALPEWLQNQIKDSDEYKAQFDEVKLTDVKDTGDGDIPF